MTVILTERVGTANFANVPDHGYDAAKINAAAVHGQRLSIGGLTECWHHDTRRAIFDTFAGHYQFGPKIPRQSALLFWDPTIWRLVRSGVILAHGPVVVRVGGRLVRISDTRLTPWALLQHHETDAVQRAFVAHWGPERPALGAAAVRVMESRHYAAGGRTAALVTRTGHPAVGLGDFNSTGKAFLGHQIDGRSVHYGDLGAGIPDQVVTVNGLHRGAALGPVRYFHLPDGDHRRRPDGPPVGMSAEMSLVAL